MLGSMPSPVMDETVYSWLARANASLEPVHPKRPPDRRIRGTSLPFIAAAFGKRMTAIHQSFPTRLAVLAANCPGMPWSVEGLINEHTAAPFYARFVGREAQETLHRKLSFGREATGWRPLSYRLGSWSAANDKLLYCEDCVRADLSSGLDTATWNRMHQLPGVYVCPRHLRSLAVSTVSAWGILRLVRCPGPAHDKVPLLSPFNADVTTRLATDAQFLMLHAGEPFEPISIRSAFRELCAEKGLPGARGDLVEMHRLVEKRYGKEGLAAVHKPLCGTHGWIEKAWRMGPSTRVVAPLSWMLLTATLGVTLAELLARASAHDSVRPDSMCGEPPPSSLPHSRKTARAPGRRTQHANAPVLDDERLLALISEAADRELSGQDRPKRLNASGLLRQVGFRGSLRKLKDRRPRAAAKLLEVAETGEQVILRRLLHVARRTVRERRCPGLREFRILAALHARFARLYPFSRMLHQAIMTSVTAPWEEETLERFESKIGECLACLPDGLGGRS